MKRISALLVTFCIALASFAQGSVTVTQSSAITDIVNNNTAKPKTQTQAPAKPQTQAPAKPQTQAPAKPQTQAPAKPQTQAPAKPQTPAQPQPQVQAQPQQPAATAETNGAAATDGAAAPATSAAPRPTQVHTYTAPKKLKLDADGNPDGEMLQSHGVDYHTPDHVKGPKIVKGAHKAAGWRIQIYNGGNKRQDRQEAERLAKLAKKKFPGMPIYVHFYSPRWMTKCGNFRTHKEAEPIKKEFINAGFKNVSIVRQQIVVE